MIHRLLRGAALVLAAATSFSAYAVDCPTTTVSPSITLPAATVGAAYSQAFSADNSSDLPFVFSITSGLPSAVGLAMTPTGTASANLAGAPTQVGQYLVTVTATDSTGCSGGRIYALAIGQGSQAISFNSTPPESAAVGAPPYNVNATASSGLPVTLAVNAAATGVCALSGTNVTFQNPGTCVIDASQAGNANYAAAPPAQQSFAVGRGNQAIVFTSTAPAGATVGGAAYSVAATANSGLAVTFSIDASAAGVCTLAGNSVSFISAGTCVVIANQAGNAAWNPAPPVQQSFAVAQAAQTISFTSTAPAAAAVGSAAYTVSATASSGLPVSFSIDASASSVCAISGSSVTFQAVGTCVINASQAGNGAYAPAPPMQQSFAVGRGSQTVTFTSTAPAAAVVGGAAYTVTATASSGLAVTFAIDASASGVCSIAGSTVSFTGAGNCVINANQAGNASYNAAPQVQQSFAVGRGSQTVTFTSTAPAAAVVGGATYTVSATATSGLAVTFAIDASAGSVCSIAGSTVSFTGAGNCVVNANQAGNASYNAAPQVQQSFAVGRGNQTVTFTSTAPAAAAVGGATYTVSATATSGLAVTFAIDASASGVCSIAGSTVSFTGAGNCVVNANQAGNTNYNAAPQVQQSFAVGRGNQTVTFTSTAPAAAVVGGATYTVSATASSGLAVTFAIDASASGVCSIAGSTVSFTGAGTCVINANQAGDTSYNAAPQVQQSFAVGRGSQTVTFTSTAPAAAVVGGSTYTVTATASSGLAVSFAIDASASSVCAIAGSTVSFTGAGTCVINANQAGNTSYNAAPQVQQSFAVGRGSQTVTFTSTAPAGAVVGGASYTVTATASSGLAVTFAVDASASSVCSIAGSTVSFTGAGTCVINANQAGNTSYNAAPQVQQSFAVGRGSQTVSFTSTAPAGAVVGGSSYTVTATASSGLAVSFAIDASASSVCSIAGSTVSFIGAGTCVINANQAGNANYNAATQVQQSFAVGRGNQTISFTSTPPSTATAGGPGYVVSATATSGLPVTFMVDVAAGGVCAISANVVSFFGAGTCVINASQAGDADYNPAPQAQQSFTVSRGSQTIQFTSTAPSDATINGDTYTVTATATSGLPVSFAIDAAAAGVCTLSGATVSFVAVGSCVIHADQAGNASFDPAPQVQQSFAVSGMDQTISFTSTQPAFAYVNGAAYALAATATSGLPVEFSIDASADSICTLSADAVSFIAAGTCVINANQPGDAVWNPAPQVQQSLTINACHALAVGEVLLGSTPLAAQVCVSSPDGTAAEFTYLPINLATSGDLNVSVVASNVQAVTGPPLPRPAESPLAPLQDAPADTHGHGVDRIAAFPEGRAITAADRVKPHGGAPLTLGQIIDINGSVGGCSAPVSMRKGRVEGVTPAALGRPAIYMVSEVIEDTNNPGTYVRLIPGSFTQGDMQNIGDAFWMDPPGMTSNAGAGQFGYTGFMNLMLANFGEITDLDNNGGLIIFIGSPVNALSPPASSTVSLGLFQQRDLFATDVCPGSNQGEILYLLSPDPTGYINSNVRTVSFVAGNLMSTIGHHYQHLANAARRMYVHNASELEEFWLDEALSFQVLDLMFYQSSVGLTPRSNIQLSTLTTGPNASRRVAAFNTFQNILYGHDRTYFLQLGSSNSNKRFGPLRTNPHSTGSVPTAHDVTGPNFSVVQNFLRYAADRKNTGDTALYQSLVNTPLRGRANLQAALGVNLDEWARDFLVAIYADDALVSGVAPQYTLPSWNYRSIWGGLGGFPLTVNPMTSGSPLTFLLGPGGGARYLRFGVAAGRAADVNLTPNAGGNLDSVTTAIIRTK